MSARLTLLILCDQSELHSRLFSAFVSANFQLLTTHSAAQARQILSSLVVDAILLWPPGIGESGNIAADLKRVAPGTPIILLGNEGEDKTRPQGIDSVCHGDFHDDSVVCGVAFFLGCSLTASGVGRTANLHDDNAGYWDFETDMPVAV